MGKKHKGRFLLEIADIIVSLTAQPRKESLIPGPYQSFIPRTKDKKSDIGIRVRYGDIPGHGLKDPLFQDKRIELNLYQRDKSYILKSPGRLLEIDKRFSHGDLYIKNPAPAVYRYYPLQHPLDKIIIMERLSRSQGALLHGCGIISEGKGLLFSGSSGSGKSTLANLWKEDKDAVILNDDRVILRKSGKRFWIYGTPWHGDARTYSAEKAVLKKIFFLRHSRNNSLRRLTALEAVSCLLAHSLFFFRRRETIASLLKLYAGLAEKIPCYELGFVPDSSILDFIRKKT